MPCAGQASAACTHASANASSEMSRSRKRAASAATIRPPACRITFSSAASLMAVRSWLRGRDNNRPDLDRTVLGERDLLGDRNRRIEIRRLDQIVAAELLLGLGEGAVMDGLLAVGGAHGGGKRRALQPGTREPHRPKLLDQGHVAARDCLQGGAALIRSAIDLFVLVDQQQELHGALLRA